MIFIIRNIRRWKKKFQLQRQKNEEEKENISSFYPMFLHEKVIVKTFFFWKKMKEKEKKTMTEKNLII